MMAPNKDAIFSVLNDWWDLSQSAFEGMWPDLEAAIERHYVRTAASTYEEHPELRPAENYWLTDAGDNYSGPTYMEYDD